jgi:biopolymer transport protein ExbB
MGAGTPDDQTEQEAMNQTLGIAQFWAQGDAVTHAVAVLLLLMSMASWYVIAGKLLAHWRLRQATAGLRSFWEAGSPDEALQSMAAQDATGIFAGVAGEALEAARAWQSRSASGIGAGVDAGEYVGRTLQQAIAVAQARVEGGLTLLASVGSTAPFVGLFGTVWGIYHALVGLSGASQVVLDKVAGPVGEALIMTAAGLFVAIPAVLAYNTFTRTNRLVLARLDGFANSLHAWLVGGLKPEAGSTGKVMQ